MTRPALRLVLLAVLMGAAAVVVGARPAAACSCARASDEQRFETAPGIVTGTVTDAVTDERGTVRWTVAVERVFKGEIGPTLTVVTTAGDGSCGAPPPGPGLALLFLFDPRGTPGPGRGGPDEPWGTGLCQQNRLVDPGGVPASFGSGHPPSAVGPTTTTTTVAPQAAAAEPTTSAGGLPYAVASVAAFLVLGGIAALRSRRRS